MIRRACLSFCIFLPLNISIGCICLFNLLCICLSQLYLLYLMCICCILCVFVYLMCICCILCVFVVLMCICCTYVYLLYSYVFLLYYVCIAVLTLDAGLLARSQYPEGPATGNLDTGFSWFPFVYKRMLRWFPSFQVAATCLSYSPSDLKFLVIFFHICVHVKQPLPPGDNPIAANKYYYLIS